MRHNEDSDINSGSTLWLSCSLAIVKSYGGEKMISGCEAERSGGVVFIGFTPDS
jgi:hypothetical protein